MREWAGSVFLLALVAMIAAVDGISLGTMGSPETEEPAVERMLPTPSGTRALTVEGEIVLDQEEKYVDTTPGGSGLVIFTGTVSVQATGPGANTQSIRVEFWISDSELETSISPSSVLFTSGGGSSQFTMSMRLPMDQDAGKEYPFGIHGTAILIPGSSETELEPAYGKAIVAAVIRVDISPDIMNDTFKQGENSVLSFDLDNTGNSPASVRVELTGAESLKSMGIHCSLEEDVITVPGRGDGKIIIHISADEDAQTGINHLDFKVMCTGAEMDTYGDSEHDAVINMDVEKGAAFSEEDLQNVILTSVILVLGAIPVVLVRRRRRKKRERLLEMVREKRREKAEREGGSFGGDMGVGRELEGDLKREGEVEVVEVVEVEEG